MRKLLIRMLIVAVLIGAAYAAGYWPQRQLRKSAEQQAQQAQQQLDRSQSLVRMAKLENQLLAVIDQTSQQNYGTAQELSKQFFDDVREDTNRNDIASARALLQHVLETRDLVTSGLARADSSVLTSLKNSLSLFQNFMGQEAKT